MKSIEIRSAEVHNYNIKPCMARCCPSAVESLMCCIHTNFPRINQNTQDKENPDNTEYKSRRPVIKNFCILGIANSERHNQEYRITLKNSKY